MSGHWKRPGRPEPESRTPHYFRRGPHRLHSVWMTERQVVVVVVAGSASAAMR